MCVIAMDVIAMDAAVLASPVAYCCLASALYSRYGSIADSISLSCAVLHFAALNCHASRTNHSGTGNMSGGSGGASMGLGSGGMMGYGDPRVDPATVISALLQSPVYTVGEGRAGMAMVDANSTANSGSDEALFAAKRGEVLRYPQYLIFFVFFCLFFCHLFSVE